jgi:Peptidase A4 family
MRTMLWAGAACLASSAVVLLPCGPAAQAATAAAASPTAGPLAVTAGGLDSSGWAGYELSGASGAFSSVSASWTQPAATCTKGDQDVAFWVGLDGVSSDSVEQIGTETDCASGSASTFGWYEMYPADPVNFTNPVKAGDVLTASVTFSGTNKYTLVLSDATESWTKTVTKAESGLARSSAEVVTSGPGAAGGSTTLTNFGKITYTGCTVNGTSMGGQSPVKVTMVDEKGLVMVSPTAMTAAGKFTNTWERGS